MPAPNKWTTSGGVVWDAKTNTFLLVKTRKEGWTWPKGKVDPDETIKEAAEREVLEESGVPCRATAKLGVLTSTHAIRHYWLLQPLWRRSSRQPDHEVTQVKWVSEDRARVLLKRKRDLKVLELTIRFLNAAPTKGEKVMRFKVGDTIQGTGEYKDHLGKIVRTEMMTKGFIKLLVVLWEKGRAKGCESRHRSTWLDSAGFKVVR